MNKYTHFNNKGFTLIELLLYISLASIIMTSISGFYITTTESRIRNQAIVEVEQQGALAMEYILQSIRNAERVTVPTVGATGNQITLVSQTNSVNPTVINMGGTKILTKEGSVSEVELTSNKVQVSNLVFINLSHSNTPGTVQVSFTLSRSNPGNSKAYDYQKTFTSTGTIRQ